MHRDQKIGLALGVLVAGFAGAFCFRSQPLVEIAPLALPEAAELDARIERLPIRAYTRREGVGTETQQRPAVTDEHLSAKAGLADRVIRFGRPSSRQVLAEGDLVDLFPGPPEPLRVEPVKELTISADLSAETLNQSVQDAEPVLPRESVIEHQAPAVLPTAAEQATSVSLSEESQPPLSNYVVKSGDTLSGIAVKFYGSSGRYLDLYRANRDVLSDPNDLPVGTTLRIP